MAVVTHGAPAEMEVTDAAKAAMKVFSTYELLENILAYLSMTDLISAQQVGKEWRSLAARTKILRQNLFLEAKPLDDVGVLAGKSLVAFADGVPKVVQPHPFLERSFNQDSPGRAWKYELNAAEVKRMLSWHSDGQWKKMLIVQPPPEQVHVVLYLGTYLDLRFTAGQQTIRHSRGGACLGSVAKFLHDTCRKYTGTEVYRNTVKSGAEEPWSVVMVGLPKNV